MLRLRKIIFIIIFFSLSVHAGEVNDNDLWHYKRASIDLEKLKNKLEALKKNFNAQAHRQKIAEIKLGTKQIDFNNTILVGKTFNDEKTQITLALKIQDFMLTALLAFELTSAYVIKQKLDFELKRYLTRQILVIPAQLHTELDTFAKLSDHKTEQAQQNRKVLTQKLLDHCQMQTQSIQTAYIAGASAVHCLVHALSDTVHNKFFLAQNDNVQQLGWLSFIAVIQGLVSKEKIQDTHVRNAAKFFAPALMPHLQDLEHVTISAFDLLEMLSPIKLQATNCIVRICQLLNQKLCPPDSVLHHIDDAWFKRITQASFFVLSARRQCDLATQKLVADIIDNYPRYQTLLEECTRTSKTKTLALKALEQNITKQIYKPLLLWIDQQNRHCTWGKMLIYGPITLYFTIPIIQEIVSMLLLCLRESP